MILQNYLTTPIGLLNAFTVLVNFAAILCVGIRWTPEGNVYMQIVYQDRGWQTAVLIFLFASFTVTFGLLLMRTLAPKEKVENLKKITIVSLLIIVVFLCAFAAAIEMWYVLRAEGDSPGLTRIVICMILSLVLFVVNLLLTMLMICNFDHYTKPDQATVSVNPNGPHPVPPPRAHRDSQPMIHPIPAHRLTFDHVNGKEIIIDRGPTPMITLPPSPPPERKDIDEHRY